MAIILVLSTSILIFSILSFVITSFSFFHSRNRTLNDASKLYHDKDGVTTLDAQFIFNRKLRIHVRTILLITAVGLVINIISAVCMKSDWDHFSQHWHLHLMVVKVVAAVSRSASFEQSTR